MTSYSFSTINHVKSSSSREFFIVFGFLFILNPLVSIFCGASWLILKKNPVESELRFWFVLMALWISLVNITKVPASDQMMYLRWYDSLENINSIGRIFQYSGDEKVYKEPIYGLFQFICHTVYFGNDKLFFLTASFISYYFCFLAVGIILQKAGQGLNAVIFGVVCCTFFNQFFYLSIHLLRQIMAFSIVLYAIALRTQDGRNHWIPLICAPLIHTTAALFTLLAIMPFIYHRMRMREYLIMLCPLLIVTVGSMAFGSMMASFLGDNNVSSYAFKRMSTNFDDGVSSNPLVIAIMIIPLSVISLLTLKRLSKSKNLTSPLYPIIYLFLFLAIMILSLSGRPLLQYRFTFVTYQFLPFILPILFPSKSKFRNTYFLIIGGFFILRFLLTFDSGAWTYKITVLNMLSWPAPFYFFAS